MTQPDQVKNMVFRHQDPEFYAGPELHRIKQRKVQDALERSGRDGLIFFKAEAVRYITDFYVKGFRPFMEPEYVVLVARDQPPVVGYISGSDDLRSHSARGPRMPSGECLSSVLARAKIQRHME